MEKLQPFNYGGVAQLGEHLPCKQGVMGSNPIISTRVTNEEIGSLLKKQGFEGETVQSELPVDISDRRMTKSGYKLEKTNGAPRGAFHKAGVPRAFFYFAKKLPTAKKYYPPQALDKFHLVCYNQ